MREEQTKTTTERLIFHVDVNSAFLSWESVRRIQEGLPDLRDIPACIGGDPTKRTGRDARPPTRAYAKPGSGSSPDCSRACPASSANPGAPADRGRHARRPAHAADENEKKETKKRKKRKRAKEENTIRHHPISHQKRKKTGHRHPGTHATDTTPRRKPHHKTASHQGEGSFFLAKNRVSGAHSRPP